MLTVPLAGDRLTSGQEDFSRYSGSRVLVTGATGFIGTHLVRRLGELGARVHAVSRTPRQDSDDPATWHVADVGDAETIGALIASLRPSVVFHLASEVTGTRDPGVVRAMLDSNLASVVNLLTAVAEHHPETRTVLAGSLEELRPEEGGKAPSSPYAVAKWAANGYARMFHQLWDVHATTLRVGMVYGPGDMNHHRLVPYVTLSLLRDEEPAIGSGTRLIDWIYVDDVVDAFLAAGRSPGSAGLSLDVGTGTATSIHDTVEALVRITGSPLRPRYGALPGRPLDGARIADIAPTTEVLGWRPTVGLEEGLELTVEWYAKHL
ncbi:NAD-dependent epimerase/dehydratase family protein [Streptosporangium sp. NPDC001559]|uniref:NAD-dependent epimerase/dehydratase family protein n=1 Tax=Streptosporangium sp. NPDC001559 TaxID=3366187 RepID=UPI0036E65B35